VILHIALTYLDQHDDLASPWKTLIMQKMGDDKTVRRPLVLPKVVPWNQLCLVGWDGQPLDPADKAHATQALSELPTPEQIGFEKIPKELKYIQNYREENKARKKLQDNEETPRLE
jgi:hypothetical protein